MSISHSLTKQLAQTSFLFICLYVYLPLTHLLTHWLKLLSCLSVFMSISHSLTQWLKPLPCLSVLCLSPTHSLSVINFIPVLSVFVYLHSPNHVTDYQAIPSTRPSRYPPVFQTLFNRGTNIFRKILITLLGLPVSLSVNLSDVLYICLSGSPSLYWTRFRRRRRGHTNFSIFFKYHIFKLP